MSAIELFRMREKVALDPKHDDKDREIVSEILKLIYGNSQDGYSLYETIQADILLGREFESDPDCSYTYSHIEDMGIIRLCEDAHNFAVDHADDLSSTVKQLEEKVSRGIPIEREYRDIINHHSSDEAIPMLLEWAGKYGFSLPKDAYPIETVFEGCFYDTPEKDKRNPFSLFYKWFSESIDLEELHRNECRLAYCKALLKHIITPMPKHIRIEFEKYPNDITIGEVNGKEVAFHRVYLTQSSLVKNEILNDDVLLEWLYNPKKNQPYSAQALKALDSSLPQKRKKKK